MSFNHLLINLASFNNNKPPNQFIQIKFPTLNNIKKKMNKRF